MWYKWLYLFCTELATYRTQELHQAPQYSGYYCPHIMWFNVQYSRSLRLPACQFILSMRNRPYVLCDRHIFPMCKLSYFIFSLPSQLKAVSTIPQGFWYAWKKWFEKMFSKSEDKICWVPGDNLLLHHVYTSCATHRVWGRGLRHIHTVNISFFHITCNVKSLYGYASLHKFEKKAAHISWFN